MAELSIIQNIILGISIAGTIGPVTIEIVKRGLKEGFWFAFILNLGACTVDATYLFVIFLGLAPWLDNRELQLVLGLLGVCVLAYLGIQGIMDFFSKKSILDKKIKTSYKNAFLTGLVVNGTSPLALVSWLGFYGFIKATTVYNVDSITLAINLSEVVFGGILWGTILSIMASMGKKFVNEKRMKYISLIAGLMLLIFAAYLGITVYSMLT